MKGKLVLIALAMAALGRSALAAPSPYIALYEQRVRFAQAQVQKAQAEATFQAARVARARSLIHKQAVSAEEYERTEADYQKSLAEVDVAKAYAAEQDSMLEVVKSLLQSGQPVPLCRF